MIFDKLFQLKKWDPRLLSAAGAAGAVVFALAGLMGYLPGMGILASLRPHYIPMAPSTAIGFLLLGNVVLAMIFLRHTPARSAVMSVIAVFVSLYGFFVFAENMLGIVYKFEGLFLPDFGKFEGVPAGRMAWPTGLIFFLAGIGISAQLGWKANRQRMKSLDYLAGFSSALALILSFIFCLAYVYGTPLMYGLAPVIPMALPTAIGFLLLSGSILALRTESFPLRYLRGRSTRSYMLRYILPLTVLSVVFGGIAANMATQVIYINPAVVSGVLTVILVCIGVFIAGLIARHIGITIDRQNEAVRKSAFALRESESKYRTLFETMEQGVVYQDAHGVIVSANPASERILGRSLDEMTGKTSGDPGWKAIYRDGKEMSGDKHPAIMALHTGMPVKDVQQGIFNPEKNGYVWIIVHSIPQFRNGENRPYQVFSTFLDVTKRVNAENEILRLKSELEEKVEQRTADLNDKVQKLSKSQQAMLFMVEDLNRITTELTEERKKLENTNAELEAFSYSVSHDLRAPLRAIDGFVEILLEDYAGKLEQEGKRVCDVIKKNSHRMGSLIDDLLAFSRLGRSEMKKTEIDMSVLANDVFSGLASPEMRKRIDFEVYDLHPAYGDPSMIRQAWVNLISNAIKFSASAERAKIEIRSRMDDGAVVYQIRDNGVGFDMKYVDKIFGVFQRLHSSREFEGTGVGLAIVQRIVLRHGGHIEANCTSGNGACFLFTLPFKKH